MLPGDLILRTTPKHGLAEAFDTAYVRHASGGTSVLLIKSYEQGVAGFYGTEQEGEWLDEEPPRDIFTEATMRTMTTNGVVYMTFMPLMGRTALIHDFLSTCVNKETLEYR
jgi:phage terminase large subunit-like protein